MSDKRKIMQAVLQELKRLSRRSFPKTCVSCGQVYADLNDFLARTQPIPDARGLLDDAEYEDNSVVDLIRVCPCGTTLMAVFSERRDTSPHGVAVREKFGQLLDHLVAAGLEQETARTELRKLLHGQDSALLGEHGLHPDDIG